MGNRGSFEFMRIIVLNLWESGKVVFVRVRFKGMVNFFFGYV